MCDFLVVFLLLEKSMCMFWISDNSARIGQIHENQQGAEPVAEGALSEDDGNW